MVQPEIIEPLQNIQTIDDLIDQRARSIAAQYQLRPSDILPLCSEINMQLSRSSGLFVMLNVSENTIKRYEKLVASAAVVAYELSQRPSIQFPAPEKISRTKGFVFKRISYVFDVPWVSKEVLNMLESLKWTAKRVAEPWQYDVMGQIFEDNLNHSRYHLRDNKIAIYVKDNVPPWPNPVVTTLEKVYGH